MNSLLTSSEVPSPSSALISDAPTPDNTGRVFTKRVQAKERSTVILSFKSVEANAMRAFIKSIRLKGDKAPSQSLVARRALQVYLHRLELLRREAPAAYDEEVSALERMVTPVADRYSFLIGRGRRQRVELANQYEEVLNLRGKLVHAKAARLKPEDSRLLYRAQGMLSNLIWHELHEMYRLIDREATRS